MNYWNEEAQRVLRVMLVGAGVRRKQLVRQLAAIGVQTSEAAIANRIYRGTPSFAFVLQVARALGLPHLELDADRELVNPLRAGCTPDLSKINAAGYHQPRASRTEAGVRSVPRNSGIEERFSVKRRKDAMNPVRPRVRG